MTDVTPPLLPRTDPEDLKGYQDGGVGRFPSLRSDLLIESEFACFLTDEDGMPNAREGED